MRRFLLPLLLLFASALQAQNTGQGGTGGTTTSVGGITVHGAITPGDCTSFFSGRQVQDAGSPCGSGAGSVTSVTAGSGLNGTPNPIVGAGTITLLNPLNGVLTIDGADHTGFGGANTTNLCTGLRYVNLNPTVFVYKVVDALPYDSEAKDPWNDATCGNGMTGVTGAMTYVFGTMNFIIGWGGTLHTPASAVFQLGGRGSENQLSLTNGCGTANPTQCTGTLFAAYQTAAPYNASPFTMTCPGCTVMATSTPIVDYAGTDVSSSGTQWVGPGTISCAGIAGSIGVQNTGAQEGAAIRDMTIVGCQALGLDVHDSTAQNFNMGPGIEILSGSKTGATIGTPAAFVGVNWSVNGPNRDLGNVTCNTRGAATTTSIAACVKIVGPGGARMPSGRVHDIHTENVKIAVLVDGARNFKIENVNTGSATQDGSTPSTMVYICGAASPAPCTTGLTSSKIKVEELAIISPSLMPNYVIDDTNTKTLTTSTWTNEYDTDAPHYGNPLTVADGGTGDATLPAAGILYGNGTNAVANITPPVVNGTYNIVYPVTASAAVAPVAVLPGVGVTANSTNYSLLYSDRSSYQKISGGTTATLTLAQITGNFASNYPFVTGNFNSGNVTFQANAADKVNNSATGGTLTLLPNFANLMYQDSSSAPGNWWGVRFPMFEAFPACADSGGNHLNFATATGFSCGTSDLHVGTVTSVTFTGDGVVLSSTPSAAVTTSGTVTATLANAAAGTVLGNPTAGSAAPSFTVAPVLGVAGGTIGSIGFSGSTSGTAILTAQATAGAVTTVLPATGTQGAVASITNSGKAQLVFSGDSNHSATVTIGSGTSIGLTSLCSTTFCPVGTYELRAYIDITTACGTSGTYTLLLTYTDDQGSKSAVTVPLVGTGTAAGILTTTSTANFAGGVQIFRSTGAAAVQYSTTAVACGTAGPMVGKMYLSVTPVQ